MDKQKKKAKRKGRFGVKSPYSKTVAPLKPLPEGLIILDEEEFLRLKCKEYRQEILRLALQ